MVTSIRNWSLRLAAVGLMLSAASVGADDSEGVVRLSKPSNTGVVRISDQAPSQEDVRAQSPGCPQGCPQDSYSSDGSVVYGDSYSYGSDCPPEHNCQRFIPAGDLLAKTGVCDWWQLQCAAYRARNQYQSAILHEAVRADCEEKHQWARCKFGYFVPTGCGAKGCPPIGHYGMVYPVDPNYFDARDGQVYAAPGVGGPVSVPLAPVVNHTYNYGWGIPSSRLTPVLHPPAQAPVAMIPSPIPAAPVAR